MFSHFRSIQSRLIFWVLAGTSLIFLLTYYLLYRQVQEYATENIQRESRLLTVTLAREIDARMNAVGNVTRQMASTIASVQPDPRSLESMLANFVSSNEQIYGSAVAFAAGRYGDFDRFALYIHEEDGAYRANRLEGEEPPYESRNWFELTWRRADSMWQEPGPNALSADRMTATYSTVVPSLDGSGPVGVLRADIELAAVEERVRSAMTGRKGFPIVASGSGLILIHPNPEYVGREHFGGLIERGVNPEYRRIAERIATGQADVAAVENAAGETLWVAYAPLASVGWSLIYVIPAREFLADVNRLIQRIALWAFLGILLLAGMVVFMARRISRPLQRLAQVSRRVAKGDLDFELPDLNRSDEVGMLNQAFGRMRDSLRHYMDNLLQTASEKQKLESELDIAAQIQRGMLKDQRFVGEEPAHYEISAMLKPARQVGGDFYDYGELPDNQLCLVVGDVSDKGVHAALFMARAITAVRSAMTSQFEPDRILEAVNAELCRNNEACMFATLICVVQDLRFGYLRYASAGHDPPLLLHPTGEVDILDHDSGPAIGLDEDAEYESAKVRLKPGDVVVLYTDGVTEAANANGELYGEQRLLRSLQALMESDATRVMNRVAEGVEVFARGAAQADDLTLLSMRFGEPKSKDVEEGMKRLWTQSSASETG